MIALIQRVSEASVSIQGNTIAEIGKGLVVLLGIEKQDTKLEANKLVDKVLRCRIFEDSKGNLNLDVVTAKGAVLVVPNFTLAADTSSGNRPGFSTAMEPDKAELLFNHFLATMKAKHAEVKVGVFGEDMQVSLINDGPITISLKTKNP
jgi:D-tyrosyl-tRNA(Tyr) deacylase|tara:strand:+ start:575 stop:1021 length:447 start_codon:yes stop_codon:yes gene_type:complete